MPDARRTFGPTVLAALGSGALCAVASAKPWVDGEPAGSSDSAFASTALLDGVGEMPLAAALSLVMLAAWGVLLVTRGAVRRAVAGLAVLAALGVVATVVTGSMSLPDDVREAFREVGVTRVDVAFTGWFWTAAATALVSALAGALAVRFAGGWPEMGSRYDAPGGAAEPVVRAEEASPDELWRAIDDGHDPTA